MNYVGIKKALREIHTDPSGGVLSWGRVASSIALVACIFWATKVLLYTHAMPSLDGATGFIVAPYVANKTANAVQSFTKKDDTVK